MCKELFNAELVRTECETSFRPMKYAGAVDPEEIRKLNHVIESKAHPMFEKTVQDCFESGADTVMALVLDWCDGLPAEVTLIATHGHLAFQTVIDEEGAYSIL